VFSNTKEQPCNKGLESVHASWVVGAQRRSVDTEAIEQSFARAGWEIDGSFSEYLIIGHNGDVLSILAYLEPRETEGPVFELIDQERNLAYSVQQIPTPRQAGKLLQEHGQPPEEEE
jgi:hypothetical protein